MARRIVLGVLVFCVVAAPALGDNIHQKQQVDQSIQANQAKLAATRASEQSLRDQIAVLSNRIGGLETQVGTVSQKLMSLQQDLKLRRQRLSDLTSLYKLQTRRLDGLKKEYRFAVHRLNLRLVAIYEGGQPSTLDFLLGSSSISDVIENLHYVTLIGKEDRRIAAEVKNAKSSMRTQQLQTKRARLQVLQDERALAVREQQAKDTADALIGATNELAQQRNQQNTDLSHLSAKDRALANEIAGEEAESAKIEAQIQASQTPSATTATPSSAGLIWPVSGPVTSPFGPRCLEGVCGFHPGLDIGVPEGTPIEAAAAGTVIYCGWEEGYGNFVMIDHGNNLVTGYGHQSRIAVTCGEHVGQGQVIGYSGCTGFCTGPHVHFEVRVDGKPVDPMGYLP
ncbi:MAG TPA: peptidoglycan DD-metalloendopeptidase family protein [Gaiellaceae bacterium]|jgi:murein DD-endopeptidase MepM/ murein hydrolase activator NlpD